MKAEELLTSCKIIVLQQKTKNPPPNHKTNKQTRSIFSYLVWGTHTTKEMEPGASYKAVVRQSLRRRCAWMDGSKLRALSLATSLCFYNTDFTLGLGCFSSPSSGSGTLMGIHFPIFRKDNLFSYFLFVCFIFPLAKKSTAVFVDFDPRGVSLEAQGRCL